MHSIVMPSSPAFLTISYFIASPTPCCPFLPLTMVQSRLIKTRYPDAEISGVPFLFVSCNPMTPQPFAGQILSRASMWPIPLTPLTAAVRTLNVLNVSSSSRDLGPAALCFLRADFLSTLFPRRFLRANILRFSLSSGCFLPRFLPSFFRRVGYSTPTTPGLLLRRHFWLLACALRTFLFSSLRVSRFSRWRRSNFVITGTVAAGTISPCWGASPSVVRLTGLHCQHRRVLASIDVMKEH